MESEHQFPSIMTLWDTLGCTAWSDVATEVAEQTDEIHEKNARNSNLIVRRGHQLHQDRRRGAGAEDLPTLGSHGMEQLGQSTRFLQVALLSSHWVK